MAVGLNDQGYDCSGLVVASICDALGLSAAVWNRDFRHLRQIEQLAVADVTPRPGDILIFYPEDDQMWVHMGIMATASSTIHADGIGKRVIESPTDAISTRIRIVRLAELIRWSVG